MKTKFLNAFSQNAILITFFISLFAFSNCSRDTSISQNIYSCSPEINDWVLKNLTVIQTFSREDFVNYDDSRQRAAFRSLTPEKKLQLWRNKLTEEMEICNTDKERDHIEKLLNMTDIKLYSDTAYAKKFIIKAQSWYVESVQKFGWTRLKVSLMVGTLYLSDESDKTLIEFLGAKNEIAAPDCACHRDFFCSPGMYCNTTYKCTESNHGCGWLMVESCIGECDWIYK